MNKLQKTAFQVLIVSVVLIMLILYDVLAWYWVFAVLPVILFFMYSQAKMVDLEYTFELMGNVNDYLNKIQSTKHAEEEDNLFHLQMAYAAIYKDDMETLLEHISKVVMEELPAPQRYYPIYIRVRARACKETNDLETLEQLHQKAMELDIPIVQGYVKFMKTLLSDDTEQVLTMIPDLLLLQRLRLHATEIEFWQAKLLVQEGKTEEALPVLETIVRKGLNIEFTEWAYETYIELTDNK